MEILFLKNDGRCRWLKRKVLKGIIPKMLTNSMEPFKKRMFLIVDWISSDYGRVGVDLNWIKGLGISAVQSYRDLPEGNNFAVVNTGYDSIVHEEAVLRDKGIEIIDIPCPYIRKIRQIFEQHDLQYQYVLLCETNHIIMKNYASIYPEDLIPVQMNNYRERILEKENGKPIKLVPYVTFLPSHVDTIFNFINSTFPDRNNEKVVTNCMWINSPSSPIIEIRNMDNKELTNIKDALLITTPGSVNKSLQSLIEVISDKGLRVVPITSLREFIDYKKRHKKGKLLLVRSPIPNKAERPIMAYYRYGLFVALLIIIKESRFFTKCTIGVYIRIIYFMRLIRGNIRSKLAPSPLPLGEGDLPDKS
ncbi:MAG: LytB [Nitrospirota bacterium]